MGTLVSIIVPVYDSEKYLTDCLDSLVCQTYRNTEIILVDDGSCDSSAAICDLYSARYPHISAIHKENGGVSTARNRGIDEAKGEYILFVDSDDSVSERFVELMLNKAEEGFFSVCRVEKLFEQGRSVAFDEPQINGEQDSIPSRCIISAWRGIYKKSVLEEKGLYFTPGRKTGEDREFVYKYMLYCNKFAYVPDAVYHYRITGASVMHTVNYSHFDAVGALLDAYEYAKRNGSTQQAEQYRKDLVCYEALRTIELETLSLLSVGERVSCLKRYLDEKGYTALIRDSVDEGENIYTSTFIRLFTFLPSGACLRIYSFRKTAGRIFRKLLTYKNKKNGYETRSIDSCAR